MKSNNKKIRRQNVQLDKKVHIPSNLGCELFKWAIQSNIVDWKHTTMGFNFGSMKAFIRKIKPRLDDYITMTWSELGKRKSCHPMDINRIQPHMLDRLKIIFGVDVPETLYQIDISPRHRVWGVKNQDVFCILWNDEEHKVYPVYKKNT